MSEIKVGEYVRTKDGYIGSYVSTLDGIIEFNISDNKSKEYTPIFTYYSNIKKHSSNIIDLIEEGDYVNGEKVKAIGYPFKESVKEVIFEDDGHTPKIATIVTKEQFKESEYKVNE